jgi:hypothetical protein
MIPTIVNLIIFLLVIGILYAVADYVISNLIPEPPQRIAKVVLIVLVALAVIIVLIEALGINTGMNVPKVTSG